MEETVTTTENNKLSYEQLEKIAAQLKQRLIQAETKLGVIDLTTIRLNYLFKVLERSELFPKEFVDTCVAEIVELLTIKEEPSEEEK